MTADISGVHLVNTRKAQDPVGLVLKPYEVLCDSLNVLLATAIGEGTVTKFLDASCRVIPYRTSSPASRDINATGEEEHSPIRIQILPGIG